MVQMYEDPQVESDSIMAWLDRRLEWANKGTLPLYVAAFKNMWLESFSTLDTVPQEYKDKITERFNQLKEEQK